MICGINSGKGKIDLVSNMIFLIGFQLNLIHNDTGLNGNGFPFFEAESVIDLVPKIVTARSPIRSTFS